MQLIVISSVLKYNLTDSAKLVSLTTYVRLKLINLCVELNCIQAISFHQQILSDLLTSNSDPNSSSTSNTASSNPLVLLKLLQIDPIEACIVREQIYTQKQRISQMKDEEAILEAQSALSFAASASKFGSSMNKTTGNKPTNKAAKFRM